MARLFNPNDRVRHAGKPEWGTGIVLTAQNISHEGKPCQRLTVRFDQAGKKTVSTAFADLRPLGNPAKEQPVATPEKTPARKPTAAPVSAPEPPPNEESLSSEEIRARLVALPEEISDPFRKVEERLQETLSLYRYDPESRALLDWATAQTGLRDTLSVLSRHELEQQFGVFRIGLDRHLRDLLAEAKRAGVDAARCLAAAPAAAQQALRRINHGR
ncbi:MAG: DUF3553 domain-containing protein [Phycisphaeraceae bacterium]|nr:MAG: DUF3553 domain-containing protein [Phycisphaeraceae bacterium]